MSRATPTYFAYLARCADDTLYAGFTTDLAAREARHNAGHGGRYTIGRLPLRIVYSESFDSRSAAMAREAALKRLTRDAKERLIQRAEADAIPGAAPIRRRADPVAAARPRRASS